MLRPAGAWGASSALERGRAAGTEEMHLLFQRLSAKSHLRPQVLSRDPWILVLDNWASEAEASTMIKAAGDRWSPDITYGSSVNSNYRNSSSFNVRLGSQEARAAAFARHFARMEYELGVGIEHADGIALLKYHPGGFYRKHHDYILPSVASAEPRGFKHCGNRQLTFMVYLSDLPEGGEGGTSYFHLGINVKPKAGRAVLWTNVFANNTFYKDERTAHEALTVRRGVKYVATTWFQAYDHRGNDENRCC